MLTQTYIAEIRFNPDPSFIDKRGETVAKLASEEFKEWRIAENRIELLGKSGKIFISHSNIGFITQDKNNINICFEKFDEALKIMGSLPPYRWGVRIISFKSSRKNFSTILDIYKKSLLNFKPKHFSKIDGKLIDIGISYVFKKGKDKYHLTTGPMLKNQASQYFFNVKLPKKGIFSDLDIYREKNDFYGADDRRSRITDFVKNSFTQGEKINEELLEKLND